MLDEGCEADDRVVPPEIALLLLPEICPGGEEGTVERHRELLRSAPDRPAVDGLRNSLENTDAVVVFHSPNERDEGWRPHQAVCVEANHVAILAAPASAKIGDVAALAVEGQLAVSVENPVRADDLGHQPPPGEFFLEDFFLVDGVAQDKKVKMIERA